MQQAVHEISAEPTYSYITHAHKLIQIHWHTHKRTHTHTGWALTVSTPPSKLNLATPWVKSYHPAISKQSHCAPPPSLQSATSCQCRKSPVNRCPQSDLPAGWTASPWWQHPTHAQLGGSQSERWPQCFWTWGADWPWERWYHRCVSGRTTAHLQWE